MSQSDRREIPRVSVIRPVKLRGTGLRYLLGRTRNLSAHGALIELERPAALRPGQRLQVAIGDQPDPPLLRTAQLTEAVVIRSLRHGDTQHLAIQFLAQPALALAS